MKIKLDSGAFIPTRAHGTDAGADLRSPIDTVVQARGSRVIDTGVHIQLPRDCVGMLKSKLYFDMVDYLEDSERGGAGFGSTGR